MIYSVTWKTYRVSQHQAVSSSTEVSQSEWFVLARVLIPPLIDRVWALADGHWSDACKYWWPGRPASNWLPAEKAPALSWTAGHCLGWSKQVCQEKSQDRLSPGRRLTAQTPHTLLCSHWSAAEIRGLRLVRKLACCWPQMTLVHGWDAGARLWSQIISPQMKYASN